MKSHFLRLVWPTALLLWSGFAASTAGAGPLDQTPRASVSAQVFADKAFNHFYNLEFDEAIANYKNALNLQPADPSYWTGLADSYLFSHLRAAGRLDARVYTASNEFLGARPTEPDPALVQAMWDALGRARSICEKRLRDDPGDAQAHYVLGLTYEIGRASCRERVYVLV